MKFTLDPILISILPGYWLLTHLNLTKYNVLRDSGYHVLIRSSIAGELLFVTASAIIFFGEKFSCDAINFINSWLLSSDAAVLALSALIALVAPPIWNSLYNDDKATRRVAEQNSDVIELLTIESLEKSLPVEISLSNSKCYI